MIKNCAVYGTLFLANCI